MREQRNKRGYESEDGIGVVYDLSSRSKCTSTTYTLFLVISLVLFTGIISFGAGFWFGEEQILKQNLFKFYQTNVDQPEIPIISDTEPMGGIFPPPMNVFGAGNGKQPTGLTKAEKKRVSEAKALCNPKRCCREENGVPTGSSNCTSLAYLECLSSDNECIWDCTSGDQAENDLHYIREFKGIDRHNAHDNGRPTASEQDDAVNENTVDPNLIVDTVDACGTMYEYHLTERDRVREENRVRNNQKEHEEAADGDAEINGGGRRRFISTNFTGSTEAGEMDEELRRKLAVLGWDGRSDVTTWTWPFYKVAYVTFKWCDNTYGCTKRCSGALISQRHLLTAGHCVSDGYGNWYWDHKVYPSHNAGGSQVFTRVSAWTFSAWHNNRDFNWDIGILTLDTTNTGHGWFAFGYHTGITSSWNFEVVGYPGDEGTTMQTQNMYMNEGITTNLLKTAHGDIVGGASGGPAYLDSSKRIYGVTSHEVNDRFWWWQDDYNAFARITKDKFNSMCSYIARWPETSHFADYID